MEKLTYEYLKNVSNLSPIACAIMSVKKEPDGSCGDIRFFAVNEVFVKDYYAMFASDEVGDKPGMDDFAKTIEGQLYTAHLPKEPNFENILFKAAWEGEYINTYVDTTKLYGFWTQDIINPINGETDDPNIRYCSFMYTLNKEMDTGKFATVSPDIASFVIKTCLELRNDNDFEPSMQKVTEDLREFTDGYACSILTIDKDFRTFNVMTSDVRNNELDIKEIFSKFPYEIIESWETVLAETNIIIIKDEHDMAFIETKAPEWVKTLRENNVETLVLVPFIHRREILGYLYITNFDISLIGRVKETLELVSFFLTAEVANHFFLERLEYLSNVDMLTGVYNRNCMNINVDELSLKLEFNPKPFTVAFCDLNGLKTINDNGGHDKGDKLLVYAADVLKEVFKDDKIFRAGGDEFTIISFSPKFEFEEKIKLLREKACDPDWLYFAIGYYHDEDSGNLRLAMRYADEAMYKDKDKFYEQYPDKRR
ncbi:GGDEF domain-containing protein [Butyrivibrio sp. CB08]|uniref:GGDEF domain-containing protein n=1 Tax=Butyrivibrio sp. CB08 TaxID=2364879 RepID=UPI000EAA5F2F|nr:GGDEF domain-containing protein [Butyrivibrio sp. CB08]RKM55986.1 GGDEF domain-containing protein [Butyrivibrio sp. CB08]